MERLLKEILSKSSSWNDIHSKISEIEEPKKRGTIFELFCKLLFIVNPCFNVNIKDVWTFSETPQKFRKDLGLRNVDYGVDLVLRDTNNNLYCVQCKFVTDQNISLRWNGHKIPNFLCESHKSHGVIIATNASEVCERIYEKMGEFPDGRVYLFDDLKEIPAEVISDMLQVLINVEFIYSRTEIELRDYQVEAIDSIIDSIECGESRGFINMASGTGKTITFIHFAKKNGANKVLV
jgi:predicted helicase